jgi:hypothetical protein
MKIVLRSFHFSRIQSTDLGIRTIPQNTVAVKSSKTNSKGFGSDSDYRNSATAARRKSPIGQETFHVRDMAVSKTDLVETKSVASRSRWFPVLCYGWRG